ncbi:hypothetical protein YC2023_007996 [Brassica napus]
MGSVESTSATHNKHITISVFVQRNSLLGSIEEPYSCHISTFSRLGSCIGLKFLHFSSKTLYFPGKVLGGLKLSYLEVLDLSTRNNNMSTVASHQITKLERRWFQCCFMGLKS